MKTDLSNELDKVERELWEKLRVERDEWRRKYNELSEQTGQALVRAHVARGDRELEIAKLYKAVDSLLEAVRTLLDTKDRAVLSSDDERWRAVRDAVEKARQ